MSTSPLVLPADTTLNLLARRAINLGRESVDRPCSVAVHRTPVGTGHRHRTVHRCGTQSGRPLIRGLSECLRKESSRTKNATMKRGLSGP